MPVNLMYADGHDLADPYLSPLFGDFTKGAPADAPDRRHAGPLPLERRAGPARRASAMRVCPPSSTSSKPHHTAASSDTPLKRPSCSTTSDEFAERCWNTGIAALTTR